jgi:ADP-heptose:LPS heptosyltransferase
MEARKVKRILLGCPQTAGDVFIATGLLPGIKNKWPDADIWFATEKRYFNILEGNPYIKRVTEWDDEMYNYRSFETWGPQKNSFDIVYTPTIVTQRIPHWIHSGFGLYMGYVYSHMCDLDTSEYGPQHIRIDEDKSLDLPDKFITVHSQTTQDPKDYEHLQNVLDRLTDIEIVQIGGKNDTPLQQVDLDLRGKTTPQTLAWVFSKAEMHLGLDSFPMHVAVHVGTPCVILFGGTYAQQGLYPPTKELVRAIEPENRFLCPTSCHGS